MSQDGEQFWKDQKQRYDNSMMGQNKLWNQTYKDSQSIRSDKHPKALYFECMKNNEYMHHYAAQKDLLVEDMSAMLCKDKGCVVNYCGLLKKSYPMEWENSSDCVDEYKQFTDCMNMEMRRYNWMP